MKDKENENTNTGPHLDISSIQKQLTSIHEYIDSISAVKLELKTKIEKLQTKLEENTDPHLDISLIQKQLTSIYDYIDDVFARELELETKIDKLQTKLQEIVDIRSGRISTSWEPSNVTVDPYLRSTNAPQPGTGVNSARQSLSDPYDSSVSDEDIGQYENRYYNTSRNSSTDNIWNRGSRAVATASGGAFLGGLLGQIPGAVAGGIFGALFGLFVTNKKSIANK